MEKLYFNDLEEARAYFRLAAYDYYGSVLFRKGIDVKTMFKLSAEQLQEIKNKLVDLQSNKLHISNYSFRFFKNYDFEITSNTNTNHRIPYHMREYISEVIDLVSDKINYLEQSEKVTSIKELVSNLPENEMKEKLSLEIKELETKKAELELNKASERERFQEEIEFGKHKAEMFEKRTNVFLKFLDRESVASIIGSILLFLMGICLLVMMFLQKEPIKIVESAFLLILGYFFGHSKNNK